MGTMMFPRSPIVPHARVGMPFVTLRVIRKPRRSAALGAVCFFEEEILPVRRLVFQHAQLMQFLGVDEGALRRDGEVDFRVGDDFLYQWQRQLRLLDADVGLRGSGLVGLDDLLGFSQRVVERLVGLGVLSWNFSVV